MWSITNDTTASMWYSRMPNHTAVTVDRPQPQPLRLRPHRPTQIWLQIIPHYPTVSTFEQRNGLTFMAQNTFTAYSPKMVLQCTQGELRIRFCSTCNDLWPLVSNLSTHKHNNCDNVNRFFPQKILPMFRCYICHNRYTLHNIGKHVVAMHFRVEIDREVCKTHSCADCDTVMYSLIQHWYIAHRNFCKGVFAQFFHVTLNTRINRMLAIMGKLTEDFQQNSGRQTLMYACLFCEYVGEEPCDQRFPCNFLQTIKQQILLRTLQ